MRSTCSFILLFVFLAWLRPLIAQTIVVTARGGAGIPANTSGTGEIKKVIADFSEAIRSNPKDMKAYMAHGKAYAAIQDFDKALPTSMPRSSSTRRTRTCISSAGRAERSGLVDEAIDDLTDAIHLRPKKAELYFHRGRLYERQTELLEAVSDFTSAVRSIRSTLFRSHRATGPPPGSANCSALRKRRARGWCESSILMKRGKRSLGKRP